MADAPKLLVDPLAGLIDISPPPAVSLWPQTWASRIAIAVLLIVVVVALVWFVRRWRANRYRREALAELNRIAHADAGPGDRAALLSVLVRRTALAAFPRERIAALTGGGWLTFLDRTYGGAEFSTGTGRDLEIGAYQPMPPDHDPSKLVALVARWIKRHHA